jgi:phage shock protein A
MGLFSRAHDIVTAKANKALDKAERPDEMLDLSYEKMLEQITQVRRALVDIAAARKRIELQEQQLQKTAERLSDQARMAVGAGREDLAREALTRKAAAVTQIQEMDPQRQQLLEEEDKLSRTLQALQARINQFRTQKETLKAQYSAAKASTSVNESVAGLTRSISDSGAALQRAQDKISGLQARSGALDELLESGQLEELGTGGDDIERELRQIGASSSVEQELAALKAGVQPPPSALTPPPTEALPAGHVPGGVQVASTGAAPDDSGAGSAPGADAVDVEPEEERP